MTLWTPSANPDHLVDYESKTVLKGRKSFNELIDEELDANPDLNAVRRTALKAKHRARTPSLSSP